MSNLGGTYPRNNGDPQCDDDSDEEEIDHEDKLIEHLERQAEKKIELDNDRW